MVEHTMDMSSWLRKQLEETSPDLLRVMVKDFAEALMSVDADTIGGADYGERSPERAVARKILIASWHVLARSEPFKRSASSATNDVPASSSIRLAV